MLVRENISFERGLDVKKSMNIGTFREFKDPTPDIIEKLTDGIYLLTRYDTPEVDQHRYLLIKIDNQSGLHTALDEWTIKIPSIKRFDGTRFWTFRKKEEIVHLFDDLESIKRII